jgi:hypothetical protein
MAVANERYVHFLLDQERGPAQRCRISFAALTLIEWPDEPIIHRHHSLRIFMKHRWMIEEIARIKLTRMKEPMKWISIDAGDVAP